MKTCRVEISLLDSSYIAVKQDFQRWIQLWGFSTFSRNPKYSEISFDNLWEQFTTIYINLLISSSVWKSQRIPNPEERSGISRNLQKSLQFLLHLLEQSKLILILANVWKWRKLFPLQKTNELWQEWEKQWQLWFTSSAHL